MSNNLKSDLNQEPLNCSECKKTIPDGDLMTSINISEESFDSKSNSIEVSNSLNLYIFCKDCAEKLNFDDLKIPQKK
jgi:hypothetical protein